ncbi:MAG: DUF1573 domain-containing protein [Chthoniobacterales bacterium]|nr:DUF1573 domain-containing protein [Chthoniobacterales bacterium]
MKISLLIFAALLTLSLPVRAALEWESREADLHPTISDKDAVAHFRYKNIGDKAVKITAVKPSCGCTTAALPKEIVAPGESGEITATFHIGDRMGMQTKTIQVMTDESADASTLLTLKADIPKLLEIAPTFLYWSKVQPLTPRTIEAKVEENFPVTKLEVTSTDRDVKAVAERVPNEKAFRITVTPKPGNRPINALLKIQPDFPKDGSKLFYANVRIDAHPAAAASPAAQAAAK